MSGLKFGNPFAAGVTIIRNALQSPGYVNGQFNNNAWAIFKNGFASFTGMLATSLDINVPGNVSILSVGFWISALEYEARSFQTIEPGTVTTTAVRTSYQTLWSGPAADPDNLLNQFPAFTPKIQHRLCVRLDARPNAAGATLLFCELDASIGGGAWGTQNTRIAEREVTANNRHTAYLEWIIETDPDQDVDMELFVYHSEQLPTLCKIPVTA